VDSFFFEVCALFNNSKVHYRHATKEEIELGAKMLKKLKSPLFQVQVRILTDQHLKAIVSIINMFRDLETGQNLRYKIINLDFEYHAFYKHENMCMTAEELVAFLNIPITNNLRLGYDI
jgi:hypothetical protein